MVPKEKKEVKEAKEKENSSELLQRKKAWEEKIQLEKKIKGIDDIACENCQYICKPNSILKHISHNKACKLFYGPRFLKMKKDKNRIYRQRYRGKYGTDYELDRQIEAYAANSKLREKKKEYYDKNKEFISKRRKKRYAEMVAKEDAENEAKLIAEAYKKAKPDLIIYQKMLDDKLRFQNSLGFKFAKANLKAGIDAVTKKKWQII